MHLPSILFMSALSALTLCSYALPVKPQDPTKQSQVRRRVAYSVVAVDGGSAATPSALPTPDTLTVTSSASSSPPSIETIVATKVVSEAKPDKTVEISVTKEITKMPSPVTVLSYVVVDAAKTSSPPPAILSTTHIPSSSRGKDCESPISTPTSTHPTSAPSWSRSATSQTTYLADTERPNTITWINATSPTNTMPSVWQTASLKKHDNGAWHSSHPSWNATSIVLYSSSPTTTATGFHNFQNTEWNNAA